jgi:hypothetical protein
MYISFLYMFQATMCQSSGETSVFMRHLALVFLYGWLSGMQGVNIPPCIPDSHPHRVTSAKCCINTLFLLMMGTYSPNTCRDSLINILRKIVYHVGFIYKIKRRCVWWSQVLLSWIDYSVILKWEWGAWCCSVGRVAASCKDRGAV